MRQVMATNAGEVPLTVATVSLPNVAVDTSVTNFIAAVTTSEIDAKNKLVDSRVISPLTKEWSPSRESRCRRLASQPAIGMCRGMFCRGRDRSGRCAYRPSRTISPRFLGREHCSN